MALGNFRGVVGLLIAMLCFGIQANSAAEGTYDFVVAQDGSGNFRRVQKALNAAKRRGKKNGGAPIRIFIKAGTYKEKLYLKANNVTLVGEDPLRTVLTYDDYTGKPDGTETGLAGNEAATAEFHGNDFTARNLTFANSYGRADAAAIALFAEGARQRYFDCRIIGEQDTLYVPHGEMYFKRCHVAGSADFIFGGSTAVFDRCTIFCTGFGYITAASTPAGGRGFLFLRCTVTGTAPAGSVFLGRAWEPYANVAFVRCKLGEQIVPEGWDDWDDPTRDLTATYSEFANAGIGADTSNRVAWANQLTAEESGEYTIRKMFAADLTAADVSVRIASPLWYKDTGQ